MELSWCLFMPAKAYMRWVHSLGSTSLGKKRAAPCLYWAQLVT